MHPGLLGLLGFGAFFALMALGVPIAFAFTFTGIVGVALLVGVKAAATALTTTYWSYASSYTLMAVPFFALMGYYASHSGIGEELYDAAAKWLGRLPGGLGIATTWACAGFAACTGSSTSGVVAFGSIAYQPMARFGYDNRLIAGVIVCGATMGTLIPPSLGFIIVGSITEESVGRLFMGGVLPGILEALLYTVVIILLVQLGLRRGPRGPVYPLREKLRSLKNVLGMLSLVVFVIGGIGIGFFTPTEGAVFGAAGSLFIQFVRRRLTRANFISSLRDSLKLSCMIYTVIMGAMVFSRFLSLAGVSRWLVLALLQTNLPPIVLLLLCLGVMFLLGMVVPATTMVVLAVPLMYPLFVTELGFNGIWFCVVIVVMMEIAVVTPPVGVNLFAAKQVLHGVKMTDIYKGVIPFVLSDVVRVLIILAVPVIATWLPSVTSLR